MQGFVSNMDEWMGAVDCIVTKAGPGTIAEAMIRGLPIMLSAFLPGQEVTRRTHARLFIVSLPATPSSVCIVFTDSSGNGAL